MADKKVEYVDVKSTLPDNQMALFEQHPDHPDGEISVYGDKTFKVALTAEVQQHLRSGELVKASASEEEQQEAAARVQEGNVTETVKGDEGEKQNRQTSRGKDAR